MAETSGVKQEAQSSSFNKKIPALVAALISFVITLYAFYLTGISFGWLFNFAQSLEPSKLRFVELAFFALFFALTLSLSIYTGLKTKLPHSAIPLALFALISIASFAVLPSHTLAFLAFALTLGSGAIMGSRKQKIDLAALNSCARNALTVFLILTVLLSVVTIESNKTAYIDAFVVGASGLAPQLGKQVLPLCAQSFADVDAAALISKQSTDLITGATYNSYRDSILLNSNSTCNLQQDLATFAVLEETEKTRLQEAEYTRTLANTQTILTTISNALKSPELQARIETTPSSRPDTRELKAQLRQVPYFQLVENYFSLFIAFILFSLASTFNFFVKIASYGLNYALLKLGKIESEIKE